MMATHSSESNSAELAVRISIPEAGTAPQDTDKAMKDTNLAPNASKLEAQSSEASSTPSEKVTVASDSTSKEPVAEGDYKPPEISIIKLFSIFLWFGCNAFGGPVVQIA